MTRARANQAEAGFTLVEVMVSLLIFGMLAAAGVAILSFSVRAQSSTAAKLDDISALNRTVSLLSGDLAQATMRPARDTAGTLLPAFVGVASGAPLVRFVRAGWSNIDGAARPGTQKVEYRLADGAFERVAYPLLDGAAPLAPVPLLTRVAAVTARYRYRGAWSDRWDGAVGAPMPDALEFTIRRSDGTIVRAMALIGAGYVPTLARRTSGATG